MRQVLDGMLSSQTRVSENYAVANGGSSESANCTVLMSIFFPLHTTLANVAIQVHVSAKRTTIHV